MTAAIFGVVGFAALFAVAGLVPLEKRSCHGSCSAESAVDCAACPLAPGADRNSGGFEDPGSAAGASLPDHRRKEVNGHG